jgi:hypothetical protein
MKQTVVEWLERELDFLDQYMAERDKNRLFEQAKEMEKHDKFNKFLNDEKELGLSDLKSIERIQWYYNTYFNETFNIKEK